jgi:hypothetical protein
MEEDEAVEGGAAGKVEGPDVEGGLCGGGDPERDAGAAGREHGHGVPQRLPADGFEDEVVRAVFAGSVLAAHDLVCSGLPNRCLALRPPDDADDPGPGHTGEPAGEEADPA